MAEFRVASVNELMDGKGLLVEVRGKRLAVFRYKEEYFALADECPHKGGSLHEGPVQEGVVSCPWHKWQFDLRSGASPINPLSKVKTYRTCLKGNDLFVELE